MQSNTQWTRNSVYTIVAAAIFSAILLFVILAVTSRIAEDQTQRLEQLSYQEGQLDAYERAYEHGRTQEYLETETLAEYKGLINQAEAYNRGWREGYDMYRPYRYY